MMTQPQQPQQPQQQYNQHPQSAQETVFYQDASPVFISSIRAVFLNQTFVIRNIASVSIGEVKPGRSGEIFVILLGLTFTLIMSFALISGKNTTSDEILFFVVFLGSIGILILGLFKFLTAAPHHSLEIVTPAGKNRVIVSPDSEYITTLANALNTALTHP